MSESHIGPYEIHSKIAQTDRHTLYRAFDPRAQQEVAIKLFQRPLVYTISEKEHLETEFVRLRSLTHPAILPVQDSGVEDNRPYIVLPWMVGGTLEDRLSAGTLSLEQVAEMFTPIVAALDAAANQGFFHSDLKPSNILFDKQGNLVIAELGLAQVLNSLTVARPIPPNPAYASPEQVRGAPLDARSQVYSLGAILYHALTGQPPFRGATDDLTLFKHVSENPRRPRELRPDLPVKAEAALLKALAKRPEDRYPTGQAFLQELVASVKPPQTSTSILRPLEEAETITSKPFPEKRVDVEAPPTPKKQGRVWAMSGLGLLALCGIALIAAYLIYFAQLFRTTMDRTVANANVTATAQAMQAFYQSRAQWPPVISDSFDSNRNSWSVGYSKDELIDAHQTVSEGVYRWEVTALDGFVWWENFRSRAQDFYLTVEAKQLNGPETAEYGILFRYLDEENFYIFMISEDQYFSVYLLSKGEWVPLIDLTDTLAIQPDQVNRLTVIGEGSRFTFFINDQFVGKVADSQIVAGRTGVAISLAAKGDEATFEFDDFELRAPKE